MRFGFSRTVAVLLTAASFAALAIAQGPEQNPGQNQQGQDDQGGGPKAVHETNPHGPAGPKESITKGSTGIMNPLITSHGGPIIATPAIYYVWYGNWAQSNNSDTAAGKAILEDLAKGIGGSPYFEINATYAGVTGGVSFGGEATDSYSQGTKLSDSAILKIVQNAVVKGLLPYNSNGVYFVLTSSDVSETSGFCSAYCGWHTSGNITVNNVSQKVRYSFVGNANRCLNACAEQTTSPNGNPGVDGMASVVAHELEEAATDPDLNNWYDRHGNESADKCAWTFGQNLFSLNNAYYNMTLDSATAAQHNRPFLIQRELSSASLCYVTWNTVTKTGNQ